MEMPLSEVRVKPVGPQVVSPDTYTPQLCCVPRTSEPECGRIILNEFRMLVTNQRPELARVKNPLSSLWSPGSAVGLFPQQTLSTELLTQPWLILNLTVSNCFISQGADRIMGIPRHQTPQQSREFFE